MELRLNGPQIAVFFDFENVATSAESTIGDFDVNAVMDLLRTRGRLLIKRAYGDWGRFPRYRRAMLENGIDLFQLYSVGIQHKNRADVRLAIDALEAVFTRPNIDLYAIISGDSDFTELIHKLRDYGKYTIGIGLRSATSDLLRRACDEFIFYETLVSDELADMADELQLPDSRALLRRALLAAEQKGETPVFAGRLKQIMLGLDSSFNEANYGFPQFRAFLEAHQDMVAIQEQNLQLYISLRKAAENSPVLAESAAPPPVAKPITDPVVRYRNFLREAGLRVVEPATRAQILNDFLATLHTHGEPLSLNAAADLLKDRYDAENALTPKVAVPDMMRLLIMSNALHYAGGQPSGDAALLVAGQLAVEPLAERCDAVYVRHLIEGGIPVLFVPLATMLYGAAGETARVAALCRQLAAQDLIVAAGDAFVVSPAQIDALLQREALAVAVTKMLKAILPASEPVSQATAEALFREASELRQKDFAGSAQRYLQASRVQLEVLKGGQARAGFDDLKWYLASYCSVKAGDLFVNGSYAEAIPYYLAFFSLAQEADSVWPRIQRLVNPMASYYFAIAGKQLSEAVPANLGRSPATQVALRIHNHANPQVAQAWEGLMRRLADVNLGIIRQTYREIAGSAGVISPSPVDPASGAPGAAPASQHTQAFLAELIAAHER